MKRITLAFLVLSTHPFIAQNTLPTTHIAGSLNIDSTMIIRDSLHVLKSLEVDGFTRHTGDVLFNKSIHLTDNFGILYTPSAGQNTPSILSFKPTSGSMASSTTALFGRGCSTFNVGTINSFSELVQIYDVTGSNQVLSMGIQNGNGVITLENIPTGTSYGTEHLKINPTCANDVLMCEGGGVVGVFKNFEIGLPTRNIQTAVNVKLDPNMLKGLTILNPGFTNPVFEVSSTGKTNIGIGRPLNTGIASNAMLSVDGLILAREIRVSIASTHWADYVFSDSYKLLSLKEIELYIKKHQHLPEVPSTEEVTKEGVNIVEMNATLLKKVEELTLYVIDLQKQIDSLKAKN